MNMIEKLKDMFGKGQTDEEVKSEKGYNPMVVSSIQPNGGVKFLPNFIRLGDGYMTSLHVYKYQNIVNDYWLEPIINMPNVLCTVDISNANKREVVDQINKALAEQNIRFENAKDNIERIDARKQYAELSELYENLTVGEILKYVHLRLYVKGKTLEELEVNTKKVIEEMEAMNFRAAVLLNEQEWEWDGMFQSYKAQAKYTNKRKGKEIQASTIAGGYPFHYTSLNDATGTFLGTTYTGGTIVLDLFHKDKQRKHYNALMVGQMGSGKSTLLKKTVLEQAIKGNKVRILDVTGEFSGLVEALGGKQIALDGSEGIINPLHVYKTAVKEDGSTNEELSFMQHLSKLKVFYNFLKPTAGDDEKSLYSSLLRQLYIEKGLWSEDKENEIAVTSFQPNEYPTFSDFLQLIRKELYSDIASEKINENLASNTVLLLSSIELAVQSIVDIYGQIFNGHSSIQSFDEEQVVSFPIRSLLSMQGEVFQAQLFNIMNMLWDGMIVNGSHQFRKFNRGELEATEAVKYLIVIDEAHNIINTKDISKPAVQYIERFMREARKYFGGIFFVSHSISDFVPNYGVGQNNENAENIKKLFQLTQYKFIAQQDSITIPILKMIFEGQITDSELAAIPRFETGHLVLSISGVKNITFKVEIPSNEMKMFGGGA
ncbi:VirB4 family type IV secretion system protein [Domibacillus robiginosus]|uniref:VirB4 family type IV secretion system protein n=1 Tax=Domibacillus robiginosus TaxID=1071054 RepID=UPI000B007195|nr:type IV secretion system protein VirB4 [Domibacillus robiginosus]